ncbi:hypothetical protein [Nostoc sp.]|uniref:hypothetical protein n=1 Tax=Nostoc sp. TaxID=1180 RepID=UPI002FF60026
MAIGDRPSICAEYKRGNVSPGGDAYGSKLRAPCVLSNSMVNLIGCADAVNEESRVYGLDST